MAVPLVLVAGLGLLVGFGLALRGAGPPSTRGGELALAALLPVSLLLGVLGAAGLLDSLVDATSPTLLPLALAYAALPGLLVLAVARAVRGAGPRRRAAAPALGLVVLLVGWVWGRSLGIPDGAAGLLGLGLLLVAAPGPGAARDVPWEPPPWVGRGVVFGAATVLGAAAVLVALVTAAFGAPQGADYSFHVQVETPDGAGSLRFRVPFLEATSPASLAVRHELLTRLDREGTEGSVGVGLDEGGRILKIGLWQTSTARVGVDLTLWGRTDHQSAFQEHRLAGSNATATVVGDGDPAGNASVTWRYTARGNGCARDATLEADVPVPGEAALEGDVREDGQLEGGYCR